MINSAFINLWQQRVGAVAWNPDSGTADFEFDPDFLKVELEISPIMMPINESGHRIYSFPEFRGNTTFKGLPGLLADILPDKYGNILINAWLARTGRPSNSLNPVEMLCFIGQRGMGALEFEPVNPAGANRSEKLEIGSLVKIAGDILSGRESFQSNLSGNEEKALLDVIKIGTSAGGARAKAVIAYNPSTGEVRSGQADAPAEFNHWLIKFDGIDDTQFGTSQGYGRVEMAYYCMAKECGIVMMESRLLEENGRAHFMTRRFDRISGHEKLHVQTFCAMRHFDFNEVGYYSYEQLFETMRMLRLDYVQAEQMYRRMVFNVLARNCDDHTKNFAFLMDKSGNWSLAPAYDICYAYRPDSVWVSQQSLSINGKRENFTREDLLEVAKRMNIKKSKSIIDQVSATVENWSNYADQCRVPATLSKEISQNLIKL